MRTRGLAIAGLMVLLASGLAFPAWAESGDMRVRFGFLYSDPTSDFSEGGQTTEFDAAFGYQASFEYLFTNLIGVEPAISFTDYDVNVKSTGIPDDEFETDLFALTASLNFHVLRKDRFDLFVGPTIGYTFWGDLESVNPPPVVAEPDDTFIYGLNLGVDVRFGQGKWGFSGALNYLSADYSVKGGSDIGVDPLQVKLGVVYKF